MSASARTGYDQLNPDQAERVDLACDRFEQAWQRGERPSLADFVGAAAGLERLVLLQELILIDLNYRCRAGERPTPDAYQCFTELPADWLARELAAVGPPRDPGNHLPTAPGYEIIAEVGRGGMGVVYRARDVRRDRPVALKVLRLEAAADPRYLERFRREARAARAPASARLRALRLRRAPGAALPRARMDRRADAARAPRHAARPAALAARAPSNGGGTERGARRRHRAS